MANNKKEQERAELHRAIWNIENGMRASKDCRVGILAMANVQNEHTSDEFSAVKKTVEEDLRARYKDLSRKELTDLNPLNTYVSYYKKFGYTYHVLLQLESILKGKGIPSGSPLVEAMFIAELNNQLLTSGHDLDEVKLPVSLKVSSGEESFINMGQKESKTVKDDFMLTDEEGIISAILRGPDYRTRIRGNTKNVLYTIYGPWGISKKEIEKHLNDIEAYVFLFSKGADTIIKEVFE